MGHRSHNHHSSSSSRIGGRNIGGEIVEVQGGHIVRSIGRKDRHSKVCTSKGPRDRRVRLAAHTAIQFYDVQDRLGYDRPSKAVDWLIMKAKNAIDELAQIPAWNPYPCASFKEEEEEEREEVVRKGNLEIADIGNPNNETGQSLGFLFPSLETGVFADFSSQERSSDNVQFMGFQTANNQVLLSGIPLGFDGVIGWPEQQGDLAPLALSQSQFFSQRGPLQSSNEPAVRAMMNPFSVSIAAADPIYPSSVSGIGLASGVGGFSGFGIPARIRGDVEKHDGYSDKPSSASSDSHH